MQSSLYLLRWSSSDGGGAMFLPSRKFASFVGMWAHTDGRIRRPTDRTSPVVGAAAAGEVYSGGQQDHYSVLGVPRTATTGDVKRAYRLLARKYHPDVSQDLKAGEIFKSIHLAYEVLSDEAARAQYDMVLEFPGAKGNSWERKWPHSSKSDKRRIYKWAERVYERLNKEEEASWSYESSSYQEASDYERGSFSDVLRFAFFTLFFMQIVGHRLSLAVCAAAALFDHQLDVGYKTGYAIAWLLGGQGGVLLALCIYFASWLCGKKSSSLVALVVVAMWVGANLARFAPLPQGAVITLLYMSIKLQVDSK